MDHQFVIVPPAYNTKYPYMKGITACINCGCWEETTGYDTCEDFIKALDSNVSPNRYLADLLSMLPGGRVPSHEPPKDTMETLDGQAPAPKEDIPGLIPETIDQDAYDAYMKTLG